MQKYKLIAVGAEAVAPLMQDKVEITDADIAMAAEYSRSFPDLRLPEAFARHREQATASLQEALADPNVVHVNMLRGGIAKPSIAQIVHIYGSEGLREYLTTVRGHPINGGV